VAQSPAGLATGEHEEDRAEHLVGKGDDGSLAAPTHDEGLAHTGRQADITNSRQIKSRRLAEKLNLPEPKARLSSLALCLWAASDTGSPAQFNLAFQAERP
jgi:hypothetical protein